MGAYSTVLPGGAPIDERNAAKLSQRWGFAVPSTRGLTAPEMIDAAFDGRLDLLFTVGGNFLEVLPDPAHVRAAIGSVPLRVHMDIVLSSQMLVDPVEAVLLLPATTRYETRGGVTETSTERRVIFSPEIPGPRVELARDEWQVFTDLAKRVRPELSAKLHFDGTPAIRADIAATIPYYDGIQRLARAGDSFQYGGPMLCANWKFETPDGKAHFNPVPIVIRERPAGTFVVSTRRGKQFNTMVQEERDALNGAGRDAVLMSPADAEALGFAEGAPLVLESEQGTLAGRVHLAPVKPGNLQVHWPEGQVLIAGDAAHRGKKSGIPDYNAVVRVRPLEALRERGAGVRVPEPAETGAEPSPTPPGDVRRPPRFPPQEPPQPPGPGH